MIDCGWEEKDILIVVKTYPTPSTKYQETVCTAGITSDGNWIRLHPIRFRNLPYDKQYSKYSWIRARVKKRPNDHRIESYQPDSDSIQVLRKVGTCHGWRERKSILLPLVSESLEKISLLSETENISLGIFRPREVHDFYWREDDPDWSPKQKFILSQQRLFESGPKKILDKIPYTFHYRFTCHNNACHGHDLTILDWEIMQSYRAWRWKYRDKNTLLAKMKEKWLHKMFGPDRDTHLIVGTHFVYGTFLVLGVFWPPKF